MQRRRKVQIVTGQPERHDPAIGHAGHIDALGVCYAVGHQFLHKGADETLVVLVMYELSAAVQPAIIPVAADGVGPDDGESLGQGCGLNPALPAELAGRAASPMQSYDERLWLWPCSVQDAAALLCVHGQPIGLGGPGEIKRKQISQKIFHDMHLWP